MRKTPQSIFKVFSQIVHILAVPFFLLLSVLFYEPKSLCDLMHTGSLQNIFTFNLSISFAIIILVMVAMRMILRFVLKKLVSEKIGYYFLWCIVELLVISAFLALYFTLMSQGGDSYFSYLVNCVRSVASVLIFPYLLLTMHYMLQDKEVSADNAVKLRFYDSRHILKFVTPASSILYIKSDENYVVIFYNENGKVKSYQLRSTMKDVEDMCLKNGMIKSHRSYIVNPSHVSLIRKDETGLYFAELDSGLDYGIPISKKYYQELVSKL